MHGPIARRDKNQCNIRAPDLAVDQPVEVRRGSAKGKCEGEVRRGSAKGKCEVEVRSGSAKGKCEGGKEGDQNQSHHREAELSKGAFEYAAEMHMSGIRFP